MQAIKMSDFDPSDLVLVDKDVDNNRRDVRVAYTYPDGTIDALRVQFPKMKVPFRPEKRVDANGVPFVASVSLSTARVGSDRNIERIEETKQKLNAMSDKVNRWMKKLLPRSDYLIYKNLYTNPNNSFPSTMKVSVPMDKGAIQSKFYDSDGNGIEFEEVFPEQVLGTRWTGPILSCVLEFKGLWLNHGTRKGGMTWTISKAKMSRQPTTIDASSSNGYRIVLDDK